MTAARPDLPDDALRADEIATTLAGTGVTANTWQSAARRLADENRRLTAEVETAREAGAGGLRQAVTMEPAEAIALTVAWAQVERGEEPMPNVAAVCVMVLERIRRAALTPATPPTQERPGD